MVPMGTVMGVEVARKGNTGEASSSTSTDRLHDDHLREFC